jgi:hypothetical protein
MNNSFSVLMVEKETRRGKQPGYSSAHAEALAPRQTQKCV